MTWPTEKYIAVFTKAYLIYLFVFIIISLTIAVHSVAASDKQYGGNSLYIWQLSLWFWHPCSTNNSVILQRWHLFVNVMAWGTEKYIAALTKACLIYRFVLIIILTSLTIVVHSVAASDK